MNIFESWLKYNPIANPHINSYIEWSLFGLNRIMQSQILSSETKIWKFHNARLVPNDLTPTDALYNEITYDAKVLVDIEEINKDDNSSLMLTDVIIAHIPLIVMPNDVGSDGIGGYFIIKGIERVLVSQIRHSYNQPIVSFAKQESKKNRVKPEDMISTKTIVVKNEAYEKFVNSIKNVYDKQTDIVIVHINLRSISEASNHSCATEIVLTNHSQILISNSKFKGKINVALILKALGCISYEDYLWVTMGDEEIAKILYICSLSAFDQVAALSEIAEKLIFIQRTVETFKMDAKNVLKFITFELFPHMGLTTTSSIVAVYIGGLVRQLFEAKRIGKADDRDSLRFKRFEPAGVLIHDLFEQSVKKWISILSKYCMKKNNIILGIQHKFLTKRILYCFSTGTWGALMSTYKRMGVSQPRATTSYIAQLSHLYRVSNPISKETRNQPVRQLHPSHQFYLCPCESPEGHTVGIVLNFAIGTAVTSKVMPVILINAMAHLLKPIVLRGREIKYTVSINGRLVGATDNLYDFVTEFKYLRRIGRFDGGTNLGMVSIGVISNQIFIWTDDGRVTRPVKNISNPTSSWREGLLNGQYQWLDSFEQEFGDVHSWSREIHPALILGITASTIPFINYQPIPRAVYASNMNKQAICSIGPNQAEKFGPTYNIGRIQQVPLVSTTISKIFKLDNYPTGTNVIVAICPVEGYNQEDAIVINRASVERGLFAADSYKTISVTEEFDGELIKTFCIPPKNIRNVSNNYCMLNSNGIIKKGMSVQVGDVLIGQISKHYKKIEDISTIVGSKHDEGIVHEVILSKVNGIQMVKIIIVSNLNVIVGDKFSSRYGQKGISGNIVDSWELPFLIDGTVPDIFMNPLALPSRMTIPTIMETLFGLVVLETHEYYVASSFEDVRHFSIIQEKMKQYNLNTSGTQLMRNAHNGKIMVPIFVGPMYYHRLSHLAEHKCYARSEGKNSKQTRQPTDGRSRQGGLRFGEMERDAIIGLNMPHFFGR